MTIDTSTIISPSSIGPAHGTAISAQAIVHPLVLLSVVDHYNRVIGPPSITDSLREQSSDDSSQKRTKRVVGVLLGHQKQSIHPNTESNITVHITNSFAVPFDEDEKNQNIWFLDHSYLENMAELFKKVNSKERIVGWYHTGPKMRSSDLDIHELFKKYITHPVLVVIDVEPKAHGIPTDAYIAIEELQEGRLSSSWSFAHVPSMIDAEEAEEIGVEHLLRDLRDHSMALVQQNTKATTTHIGETALSSIPLSLKLNTMISSLKSFTFQLYQIQTYLGKVISGLYPPNSEILSLLQDIIFNLIPDLDQEWYKAHLTQTNDQYAAIYVSWLMRSILSLHALIHNKLENKEAEKKLDDQMNATNATSSIIDESISSNAS